MPKVSKGLLNIQNVYKLNSVLDIKFDFVSSRTPIRYLLYLLAKLEV